MKLFSKTTNLAIMFADISGSTRLFETLGDEVARTTIAKVLDLLSKVIKQHQGTIIKTIGDEIMCTFPTADDAANAANQMQENLENVNSTRKKGPELKIRVGMHYGPALLEKGDVFGDAVNVAARMAAQAKGGQIITTKTTVALLEPNMQASSRFVDRAPIKGKKEDIEIFEIIWQEEDVTRMAPSMLETPPKQAEAVLYVKYGDKVVTLNQNKAALVMGRSDACDLPINEKLASRQHVRIELRRNKFFIIDQSTNGTHIRLKGGQTFFLRREETPIDTSGHISLGKSFTEKPTELVTFVLKT